MAEEPHELVIIRRRHDHEDSHHGGAWKIAFADFMTAMMALFLVLWLISSTTPKVKVTIARYFNPVKLVELSPMKKGFNDPVESEAVSGTEGKGPTPTEDAETHPSGASMGDDADAASGPKPKHSEGALFRDPYAVLAEIASSDEAQSRAARKAPPADAPVDQPDPFRDPFATIPRERTSDSRPTIPLRDLAPQPDPPSGDHADTSAKADAATATRPAKPIDLKAAAMKPAGAQTDASRDAQSAPPAPSPAADAAKLQGEISRAIANGAGGQPAPNVEVRVTSEGLLISLTDEQAFAMFAVGSAEPQAKTLRAMEVVAQLLKTRPGKIVIRGYTDGRPYKSANYDNWRLSSARAHMAQYMLVRGGFDEKRVAAIEGFADRHPKIPADPMAAENRRIEILLQVDKP